MKQIFFCIFLFSVTQISFPKDSDSTYNSILSIFSTQIKLSQQFQKEFDSHEKRIKLEKYSEEVYDSILPIFKNYICKDGDSLLLHKFMNTLVADSQSADETPSTIFGEIFICRTNMIIRFFNKFSYTAQKVLYSELDLGYKNAIYPSPEDKNKVKMLNDLFNKLKPYDK